MSRSACADDVTLTRLNERETARAALMWMSVEVVSGIRIVQCYAIIVVVIDVRVIHCHQAIDNSGFSAFLNFPLRVQILILLSCCINSSSLFPVATLCTLLHRENMSFDVWYLQQTERTSCDTKDSLDALHAIRRSVGCGRHVQEDGCTPCQSSKAVPVSNGTPPIM